ncbi:MAG: radical SAM protein, partial [Elusimicrobiota bacterium]
PFNCTYCFNHIYHSIYRNKGKLTRTKSVGYLINEIKDTLTKFPVSFVKFYDDIFGSDREWLTEFAGRYPKEIGLPYLCFARLNLIDDEYCRLMKKSGCFTVITAIECGNETVRNNVLNRNMTDEQIISGFEKLKKYGIRTYSVNMLGLPGETEKELLQTLHINQKVKTDFADASIFQPFPGTRLAGYCKQNGYVDNDFNDFQSIFSRSVLNFEQSFKDKVYITHKVFSFLVSHPRLNYLLKVFYIMGRIPYFKNLFNLFYRSYYGVAVYRKIYGCRIPIGLCLRGAFSLLFSRSRI